MKNDMNYMHVSSISKSATGKIFCTQPFIKSATGSAPVQSAAGLAEPDKSTTKSLADPSKAATPWGARHRIGPQPPSLVVRGDL